MKVVYALAKSVPEDCDYIKEGDEYRVLQEDTDGSFMVKCADGSFLEDNWSNPVWVRLEYPYRDPRDVEAAINALHNITAMGHPRNASWANLSAAIDFASQALARLSPDDAALGGE